LVAPGDYAIFNFYNSRDGTDEFKQLAKPFLLSIPIDDWEWLAVAQHHGLATRLLDWTLNPLVALYFAVGTSSHAKDGIVFCVSSGGDPAPRNVDPLELGQAVVFYPPHISSRIPAQAGCFSVHPDTSREPGFGFHGAYHVIMIPRNAKQRVLIELARLGITRATLFPSLDGAADAINAQMGTGSLRTEGT
jgi:hypothetical protein